MLCLVTDRRRADVLEQAQRAVDAGIDLIQVRERDLEAAALCELAGRVVTIAARSRTRVLVNDRVDVAVASGAHGVHLRADSVGIADARVFFPRPGLVGRSVHSADEARSAVDADYVIAGTVYPTPSKAGATRWLGVHGLKAIVDASPVPVLAIGGISMSRFDEIAGAGAAGIAAIGLFTDGGFEKIVRAARAAFDTVRARP